MEFFAGLGLLSVTTSAFILATLTEPEHRKHFGDLLTMIGMDEEEFRVSMHTSNHMYGEVFKQVTTLCFHRWRIA